MSAAMELDRLQATDGEIAAINLTSARRRAWTRFAQDAGRTGFAEAVIQNELLAAQFLGDLDAFDRLETFAAQLARLGDPPRAALLQAQVASAVHRFDDARRHLARGASMGAPSEEIARQVLTIDQACGVDPERIVASRSAIAAASCQLEDLVPFGAALADLERFTEADAVYRQALADYDGISPFPAAWVCFQLGALWGELAAVPDADCAAAWYRRALAYLPGYVKARVHLAEISLGQGQTADAEALLLPALASSDPEVRWRLGDVLIAQGRLEEAVAQLEAARLGFEDILEKHLLAFADHAAEFYAGSGNDPAHALELARVNAANRPTRRALAQVHAIAAKGADA